MRCMSQMGYRNLNAHDSVVKFRTCVSGAADAYNSLLWCKLCLMIEVIVIGYGFRRRTDPDVSFVIPQLFNFFVVIKTTGVCLPFFLV